MSNYRELSLYPSLIALGLMTEYANLFFNIDSQYQGPILFISGEKSQNIKKEDEEAIRAIFPNTQFSWLPNTGQWMHLEKHGEVMKKVVSFLEVS
jgi:pimeloyl-ACP methyl ester carboxylesterase